MNYPQRIRDQMKRELRLSSPPRRIISLVPSITELLHDLGLVSEVVGVTKFCIHPKDWCKSKQRIGGTKKVNFERIAELKPDLIIGNKEENTKEDISLLEKNYNVLMTDVNTFEDALEMILLLSKVCNKSKEGLTLHRELVDLRNQHNSLPVSSAIYLIWKDPFFAVGKHTFIHDMLSVSGFKNLITTERYPEISIEEINQLKPEFLLLSTEPYPFDNNYLKEIKTKLNHTSPILVDGEMFSWYGSRLKKSFAYFNQLKTDLGKK